MLSPTDTVLFDTVAWNAGVVLPSGVSTRIPRVVPLVELFVTLFPSIRKRASEICPTVLVKNAMIPWFVAVVG
jgi:hypothetical protein